MFWQIYTTCGLNSVKIAQNTKSRTCGICHGFQRNQGHLLFRGNKECIFKQFNRILAECMWNQEGSSLFGLIQLRQKCIVSYCVQVCIAFHTLSSASEKILIALATTKVLGISSNHLFSLIFAWRKMFLLLSRIKMYWNVKLLLLGKKLQHLWFWMSKCLRILKKQTTKNQMGIFCIDDPTECARFSYTIPLSPLHQNAMKDSKYFNKDMITISMLNKKLFFSTSTR